MHLSQRILAVKPSATLSINAKAAELKAQGQEIISLAAGEPDFQPPKHVLQAAKDAIDQGFVRYTPVPGLPELRQAVAGYCSKQYGHTLTPNMTIATNGGKQGLYSLFQCLLDPGDEVLIPAPYWVSYPDMVALAQGNPVVVPSSPDRNFRITPSDLQPLLTDRTRILVLNTPSNPTGSHYTQAEIDDIISWAVDNDVFVISDEIYDQLVYPPAEPATAGKWLQKHPMHVAVCNGLSKSFAMTGWRMGYVLAHPDLIAKLSTIQGQSTSNVCVLVQKAAVAALQGPTDFLQEQREVFQRRRDLALEHIASWPGISCPEPDGAFYLFPRMDTLYSPVIPDSTALCTFLLEKAKVALVPGGAFGDDRCVRISYALDDRSLVQALDRLKAAVCDLADSSRVHE
ncbi:pyridoxal phosphate-dependent aminotransferase [Desulfovermiculus halophilus]|uniref:pyridoxal phosphate-dependent aminotransferase n=1 Tax=Desulfovermiculus halophilus TaxID=339722 RepID=UPI0006840FB6|nr:pyridoxal phosphate-dependent aminotransferase [Desulfovermiculus halophilus]